ncbi:triphosphoribosyl-dephospho-CoA synthase [Oryzibacter oryziterrae]|uniref:triphosphoribosyl-dephospho-CoA synthase n=1 Tax=Oryzibacter oryziterrae TaxID=2766474 RepID=UPI001F2FFE4C|nr:triphosphoribosyl-dephospho-CoA synthase [Oryzibacter oryziterrae]
MSFDPRISKAFEAACRAELAAPKPGNVHVFADGHRMRVADFERSAAAAAPFVAARGASVGTRVLGGMQATWEAVGTNTNLGILLLAAPLALAAERVGAASVDRLRDELGKVLAATTVDDSQDVFAAIRRASPAGLGGAAEEDVSGGASLPLIDVMGLARERDRIARQYVTTFEDVFEIGFSTLLTARERGADPAFATASVYVNFASRLPDTHIERKYGAGLAEEIRRKFAEFGAIVTAGDLPRLLAFDQELKGRGVNPGTSADLTVATEFLARLVGDL